jgi:hypothetical protein
MLGRVMDLPAHLPLSAPATGDVRAARDLRAGRVDDSGSPR